MIILKVNCLEGGNSWIKNHCANFFILRNTTSWQYRVCAFFLIWGYFISHRPILPPSVAFYHFNFPFLFLLAWSPTKKSFEFDRPQASTNTTVPYGSYSSLLCLPPLPVPSTLHLCKTCMTYFIICYVNDQLVSRRLDINRLMCYDQVNARGDVMVI